MVALVRWADLTVLEVDTNFGIAEESGRCWMSQADIDEGIEDGITTSEQSELVLLRRVKRRLEMGHGFCAAPRPMSLPDRSQNDLLARP